MNYDFISTQFPEYSRKNNLTKFNKAPLAGTSLLKGKHVKKLFAIQKAKFKANQKLIHPIQSKKPNRYSSIISNMTVF